MRRVRLRGWLAAALFSISPFVHAVETVARFDPARCEVQFKARILWMVGVHGRFSPVEGEVHADDANDQLRVAARIDIAHLHMKRASDVRWAQSDAFFDMARHPRIVFDSDPFPRDRLREGGPLAGRLAMHGRERRVEFRLLPSVCAQPGRACSIRATGSIRRSEFGLGGRGMLADAVELNFSVFSVPAASP